MSVGKAREAAEHQGSDLHSSVMATQKISAVLRISPRLGPDSIASSRAHNTRSETSFLSLAGRRVGDCRTPH